MPIACAPSTVGLKPRERSAPSFTERRRAWHVLLQVTLPSTRLPLLPPMAVTSSASPPATSCLDRRTALRRQPGQFHPSPYSAHPTARQDPKSRRLTSRRRH